MTTLNHLTEKEILSRTLYQLPKPDLDLLKILGTLVEYANELWKVNGLDMVEGFVTLINVKNQVITTHLNNVKVAKVNFK